MFDKDVMFLYNVPIKQQKRVYIMNNNIEQNISNIRDRAEKNVKAAESILESLLKCDVGDFVIQQALNNLARHIDRLDAINDGSLFHQQPWLAQDGW